MGRILLYHTGDFSKADHSTVFRPPLKKKKKKSQT